MRIYQLKNPSFLKCHKILALRFSKYATEGCTTFQDHRELTTEIKHDVDKHWRNKLPVINFDENKPGNKYFVVPMFPYPSGALHMGHVRVYTISDTVARFHRMNGKNVLHPIGWDSFGLPAENAAIERGLPANEWTKQNIDHMRVQLEDLGCSFDWTRELSTCDPSYYKWTQWLFLKLHKEGLAYQKEALVNWDPVDQTVLANEQVDAEGNSWRSGAKVEKKLMKQWFVRTTKFAKKLYDGLDNPDLEDYKDIIQMQKHWIGEPNGYSFDLEVFYVNTIDDKLRPRIVTVWTEHPEYMKNVGFIAIKPEHILNESKESNKLLDITVKNPFNEGELIPIIVTNDIEYLSCDVHLGMPSVNESDKTVADKFLLSYNEEQPLEKHRDAVIKKAKQKNIGGFLVSAKLQDWPISRQRYWGTPIPVIHCEKCGVLPVPEAALPVQLPENTLDENSKPIPVKDNKEWVQCKCPKCSGSAKRETDTMDTFVDSSWYFLRYLSPKSNDVAFNKKLASKMMPLDLYVGGKEHGCLHLYYARFITYFLHQLGLVPSTEPFKRLLVQGLVMGRSYQLQQDGQYITADNVNILNEKENRAQQIGTGKPVVMSWEKMSKSKRNGVDPLELFAEHSVDSIRLIMLGDASPWSPRNWSTLTFPGILKWQNRVWLTVTEFNEARQSDSIPAVSVDSDLEYKKHEVFLFEKRNYNINETTYSLKCSQQLNSAIKRLQALTDALRQTPKNVMKYSSQYERALAALIIMTAPMAPSFASELWSRFLLVPNRLNQDETIIQWSKDVLEQKWPAIDENYQNSLQIKANTRLVHEIKYSKADIQALNKQKALEIALKLDKIIKLLEKKTIVETGFSNREGYDAVLHISIKSKDKVKKNKSKQKQKDEVAK